MRGRRDEVQVLRTWTAFNTAETKLMSSVLGTFLTCAQEELVQGLPLYKSWGISYTPIHVYRTHRHFLEWDSQLLFGHLAAICFPCSPPPPHYQPLPIPSPSPPPTKT